MTSSTAMLKYIPFCIIRTVQYGRYMQRRLVTYAMHHVAWGDGSNKSHDVIIQVSWPSIQFIAFFSICVLAALAASCAPFSMPHASSDHCEVTACVAWTCLWASFLWGVLYPWWSWYYQYVLASGIMYHYICISLFLSIDTCSCRPRWPALKSPYG